MRIYLNHIITVSLLLAFCFPVFGQKIDFEELEVLVGAGWNGIMKNYDYDNGEIIDIPAVLFIQPAGKRKLDLVYRYPEDSENLSKAPLRLNKNGTKIGLHKIVSKTRDKLGRLVIKTKGEGKVEWQKVQYFYTYIIGKNHFAIKREIWFMIDDIRIVANDFTFKR